MIFCAKNENGVSTYDLVMQGLKTVTRRDKPLPIGKRFAIQLGRGKKAGGYGKVLSCENTLSWWLDWVWANHGKPFFKRKKRKFLLEEAEKEGFISWNGLSKWFKNRGKNILYTYRIEFEVIKKL